MRRIIVETHSPSARPGAREPSLRRVDDRSLRFATRVAVSLLAAGSPCDGRPGPGSRGRPQRAATGPAVCGQCARSPRRRPAPATGVPGGPGPIGANAPGAIPLLPGEAGPVDYKIGPQDLIEIQVFGIDNLKREVRVNSRGPCRCR